MKNKLIFWALLLIVITSCTSYSTAPVVNDQVIKTAYSVEHEVMVELQIKSIDKNAMQGYFLRSIALRGHDMSAMATANHEHGIEVKDQPVNLLDELVKCGGIFKAELYTSNQRLLIKKDTALFACNGKTYFVDGELVDTHGVRGGALSLAKGNRIYFKIK